MSGPFEAAGSVKDVTKYAALGMGARQFTGLWTQRSPFRDAAVSYLTGKFYSASRFDSILDGINREISMALTDDRRPGSSIYNSASIPPVASFYAFKYVQNSKETIKVLADAKTTSVTQTLNVASVQRIASGNWPHTRYFTVVTFTAAVPAFTNGQVYTFSGLTNDTSLNGQALSPYSSSNPPGYTPSAYTQIFYFGFNLYGPTADTGSASIANAPNAVLDVTGPNTKTTIFSKDPKAGPTRFLGVGTILYMCDGVDQKKWVETATSWQASTAVSFGTIVNVGAEPGTIQMALGGATLNIVQTSSDGTYIYVYFDPQNIPNRFASLSGAKISFAGLTTATALNGNTYTIPGDALALPSSTLGIMRIPQAQTAYDLVSDTGSATTGTGTTGATSPVFSTTEFAVVADGGQQWKCYGPAIENMGLVAPTNAPVLTPVNGCRYWQANTVMDTYYAILDSNQNVELWVGAGGRKTGLTYPTWKDYSDSAGIAYVTDGDGQWGNWGSVGAWAASTLFGQGNTAANVILDSNNNWQFIDSNTGASGSSEPTWATTVGATTVDNLITGRGLGPGVALTTASVNYGFSTRGIDGSVSTSSPKAKIPGPIVGPSSSTATQSPTQYVQMTGSWTIDTQINEIWIWRTAQGESTLILEDQIPADPAALTTGTFTYNELGIADTSTNGNGSLNAEMSAPVSKANEPPPTGLTGMVYQMSRIWGFVENVLYNSGGPDTLVGSGNTAWPPANQTTFPANIVKLLPVLVDDGGLLVFTTSGIKIILGKGTSSDPFYESSWCDKINLGGYNVLDVLGTEIYLMESNKKVSSLQIKYPFDPQSNYSEVGFAIGDQFQKVTTGDIDTALYDPASSYLSWNIAFSGDTGMYVADGSVGWFRMSNAGSPESGTIWHPRAAIAGGTSAVQSVETSPGVFTLLIGPAADGPILQRDQTGTVFKDNGTAYPAWDAKGVQILCATGQIAELAHIATKSMAVGARPTLGLLMNEIKAVAATLPWNILQPTCSDPPSLPPSRTVFSDRYSCDQNGFAAKGDCCLIKFDYGAQAFGDKLLDFQIYGSKEDERKAQPTQ